MFWQRERLWNYTKRMEIEELKIIFQAPYITTVVYIYEQNLIIFYKLNYIYVFILIDKVKSIKYSEQKNKIILSLYLKLDINQGFSVA